MGPMATFGTEDLKNSAKGIVNDECGLELPAACDVDDSWKRFARADVVEPVCV